MNYNQQNNYNPSTICERCGYDNGNTVGTCPNCKTTYLSENELNKKAISTIKLLDTLSLVVIALTVITAVYCLAISTDYIINGLVVIIPILVSGLVLSATLKFFSLTLIYLKKIARK